MLTSGLQTPELHVSVQCGGGMCTTEAVAQGEVRHGREGSDEQGSFPGGGNDA